MAETQYAALSRLLKDHVHLGPSRRQTLGELVGAIVKAGTVNLNRLAAHIESDAQTASVHRRLERFFSEVRFDAAEVARLTVSALGLCGRPWHLAIDRTNWKFGRADLNVLVLSVAVNRVCVPLFWTILDKAGCSSTAERIDLMQSFLSVFPHQKVASFAGDREFIGNAWIAWLHDHGVPYVLRLRESMKVFDMAHVPVAMSRHAAGLKPGQTLALAGLWRIGPNEADASPPLRIVIKRLADGELLALASCTAPARTLSQYRKRWQIETLFAALKTRGFNLEATHITMAHKLSTLVALLSLAAAFAYKAGLALLGHKPIRRKAHGRPARSLFAHGLDAVRKKLAPFGFAKAIKVMLTALLGDKHQLRRLCMA
jgi:hypothetical protein